MGDILDVVKSEPEKAPDFFQKIDLDGLPESVLLYGQTKCGKTWSYCGTIETELERDPDVNFYICNTDNGFQRTFKAYFGVERAKKLLEAGTVKFHFAADIESTITFTAQMKKMAKQGILRKKDWIIFDLISDFKDQARAEVMDTKVGGGNLVDYLKKNRASAGKFGGLEPSDWVQVARYELMPINLVQNPICNVLAVASEKAIDIEKLFASNFGKKKLEGKKEEFFSMFEKIGQRPAGNAELAYKFSTIIYLAGLSGLSERSYIVVGDRGGFSSATDREIKKWKKNFWKEFLTNERGVTFEKDRPDADTL